MATLNIVDLIEKNPIIKLSASYNNKLINKIKEDFTDTQQQLFVSSFYCYLNYDKKKDYVIDLDDVWKWLGFTNKANAKKLLEKYFIVDKDYKNLLDASVKQDKKHGGHNKELFIMNITTFKLLCLKAATQKSAEVHSYFIKLEEFLHDIVEEETDELKIQLIKIKDDTKEEIKQIENKTKEEIKQIENKTKKEYELKLIQQDIQKNQNFLLNKFGTSGPLIYIVKVKSYEDGCYVIKIGESRKGVAARYAEHKKNYEEAILLDCFEVNRSNDFESFIHNHKDIKPSKVRDLPNHTNENELFLIGKELSYATIINLITNNIHQYNDANAIIRKLELELEKINLTNKSNEKNGININEITELLNNITNKLIKELINKVENLEKSINKEILSKLNLNPIPNPINTCKTVTNFNTPLTTLGPRLQQINPDTLKLVKVYESVSELIAESNNKLKRPTINKAVVENTVYHGYRYLLVDRDLDANIITHIEPTKKTKIQNTGYIAQINKDKTEILNVYLDRKTAAKFNGHESSSALDLPVKNYTINHGHFYKLYEECEEDLREDFLIKNDGKEPFLYKQGVGRFDVDNNLVDEFACKFDCIKSMRISDKTLAKALESKQMYNNFYYRYLDSKLKC